jgi:hypothetical protein
VVWGVAESVRAPMLLVVVVSHPGRAGPAAAISPRVKRTMAAQRMRVNVSLGMDAHAPVSRTPKEPSTRKASSLVPRRCACILHVADPF